MLKPSKFLCTNHCKPIAGFANTPNLAYFTPKLFRWLYWGYGGSHFTLVTNIVLSLPFSQQIQFTLIVNLVNLNLIIEIKELYCTAKQEGGKLRSKFTRWPPSWIWAFQVSGPPQLFRVSLTIVYTRPDHMLESLNLAFFVVILDSKYSIMTPKFVKQKSLTPLINKICKPCHCQSKGILNPNCNVQY